MLLSSLLGSSVLAFLSGTVVVRGSLSLSLSLSLFSSFVVSILRVFALSLRLLFLCDLFGLFFLSYACCFSSLSYGCSFLSLLGLLVLFLLWPSLSSFEVSLRIFVVLRHILLSPVLSSSTSLPSFSSFLVSCFFLYVVSFSWTFSVALLCCRTGDLYLVCFLCLVCSVCFLYSPFSSSCFIPLMSCAGCICQGVFWLRSSS